MTRYEAFINRDWRESGMQNLVVARIRGPLRVEIGIFLTDCWCLGVKDAMYLGEESEASFDEFVNERLPEALRERIHPACAKKLIYGAVAYAERLGFEPHHDYGKARRVLGGIDPAICPEEFTFGKDGKPFYIAGESDTPERIHRVLAVLKTRCGADGFHHMVRETVMEESDDEENYEEYTARDYLVDFLGTPAFFEFSGMATAMHVCPQAIMPTKLLERFWEPDGHVWESAGELQEFMENLQLYWNETADRLVWNVDAPPAEVWPLDILDDEEKDDAGFVAALIAWCGGFMRATSEWPEAWGNALARPDLAPHWAIVRAWANPEAPENAKFIIDVGQKETPELRGQTLPLAIVALYRALRS